jgi:mRNA interferase MazF
LAQHRGGFGLGRFVKGDVVVLNFPFSDLSQTKRRPALVLATLQGNEVILCQITSQARVDAYSLHLELRDFSSGGLNKSRRIGPNRIFTADEAIIAYSAGHISETKLGEVVDRLIAILKQP